MKRGLIKDLHQWKARKNHKPLIIRGARQVGKTWLMKTFGEEAYAHVAYINFDNNARMAAAFAGDFNIKRLVEALQLESGVQIDPKDTLIIFDEIQEAPLALTSLKYFRENAPEYDIIAAGSLLGVALHAGISFPVGKVEFMDMYPMNFSEFLVACGEKRLADLLKSHDWDMITIFKSSYTDLLKKYYFVGGMPEAVAAYRENQDYRQVREIQNQLLVMYDQDFSKHAPPDIVPRIRLLWNSIPSQLAKENRKFIYGALKPGARAREYEMAMSWLIDCGLVHKVNRVTKYGFPLKAYEDFSAFKLFMSDVGLMGAITSIDSQTILEGNRIFEEYKGTLTEQYVLQQLLTAEKPAIYYWAAEKSTGEIDFLLQHENRVTPLEVKAEENLQAKSLRLFCQRYQPQSALRSSMSDFRKESWLTNLPLYAILEWKAATKP